MPVDTTSDNREWTFGTMLSHVTAIINLNDRRYASEREDDDRRNEQRFLSSQLAVDNALNAAKEAVRKAEIAAEKRFDSVNEFRATLSDQQRTLMPRVEADLQFGALRKEIDELTRTVAARNERRSGAKDLWGYIIGALGALIGIIAFLRSLP